MILQRTRERSFIPPLKYVLFIEYAEESNLVTATKTALEFYNFLHDLFFSK